MDRRDILSHPIYCVIKNDHIVLTNVYLHDYHVYETHVKNHLELGDREFVKLGL